MNPDDVDTTPDDVQDTNQQNNNNENVQDTSVDQESSSSEQVSPSFSKQTDPDNKDEVAIRQQPASTKPKKEPKVSKTQPSKEEPKSTKDSSSKVPEYLQKIQASLDEFAHNMALNQNLTPKEMARYQMRFRSAINNVLNLEGERFDEGFNLLIEFVRKHRNTLFAMRNVFRGFRVINLSETERKRFEHLVNLITCAADFKNPRQATNTVDLKVMFRYMDNESERQKISNFFS